MFSFHEDACAVVCFKVAKRFFCIALMLRLYSSLYGLRCLPRLASATFATCSGDFGLPFKVAAILARVSVVCGCAMPGLPLRCALIAARCSGDMVRPLIFAITSGLRFCPRRLRFARSITSGECPGFPFCAALIFARVSSERGIPLRRAFAARTLAACSGCKGLPFLASDNFARASGVCVLPVAFAAIFARASGVCLYPRRVAAPCAILSGLGRYPLCEATVRSRRSGVQGIFFLPRLISESNCFVSALALRPWLLSATLRILYSGQMESR